MRKIVSMFSVAALSAACSSSTDGEECPIVGTYSMTGVIESTTCSLPPGDGQPTTVQISRAQEGDRAEFVWSFAGAVGRCGLTRVGGASSCKLEGPCPITITDATDPSNNQGQILISWTFNEGGFEGLSTFTAPPFKDHPQGCTQTAKNTASRR
jgi:type 1 fimbria pilin